METNICRCVAHASRLLLRQEYARRGLEKTPLGFRVTKIFGGGPELLEARSPLARPEANVKLNETIIAVNGIAAAAPSLGQLGELLRNQNNR